MPLDDTSRAVGRLEGRMDDLTTEVHNVAEIIGAWKKEYDEDRKEDEKEHQKDQEVFRATKSRVDIMWKSIIWLSGILAAATASATTWLLGWVKL
jgi:hypothetical protein